MISNVLSTWFVGQILVQMLPHENECACNEAISMILKRLAGFLNTDMIQTTLLLMDKCAKADMLT